MAEIRKLAAILCSDVVGYSRLAAADEDRILARLRALRSDLIDPTIAVHNGRIVKRTGDGRSSNSAASSMRFAAPSKCRTPWSSAMPACPAAVARAIGDRLATAFTRCGHRRPSIIRLVRRGRAISLNGDHGRGTDTSSQNG
jgi:class 3 adenylate cyclase